MSDENPFAGLGGMFDFEGQMKQQQAAQQRAQMETDAILHDLHAFFDTLDREQLTTVAALIRIVQASSESGYLYIGLLAGRLSSQYGVCAACGKNHDEQLLGQDHESS